MINRIITSQAYGGLGNRLLTISSLYRVSKILNAEFRLHWIDMPGVMEMPLGQFYNLPFDWEYTSELEGGDLYSPSTWSGRFYIPNSILEKESFALDFGPGWYHCIWIEPDLIDFDDSTPGQLTNEIRLALQTILQPSAEFSSYVDKFNPQFDLGIHVRTAIADDFKQGQAAFGVWPDIDQSQLVSATMEVINETCANTCFIASPSREIEDILMDVITRSGVNCASTRSLFDTSHFSADELLHLDFHYLCKCSNIFRRSVSTFSGVAAIVASSNQFVFDNDYQITRSAPLLFSGRGL